MVDLADPLVVQDPYPTYAWLREQAPVHRWELDQHPRGGIWLVTRYADVRALLADDRLTKRAEAVGLPAEAPPVLMFLDPPEHTRLRRPATRAFTRVRAEGLRSHVVAHVDELLAPLRDGATVEVVSDVATPLPVRVVLDLLGVDRSHAATVRRLAQDVLDLGDGAVQAELVAAGATHDELERRARDADTALMAFMDAEVAARVTAPGDDLLSALLTDDADDAPSREEVSLLGAQLLVNGQTTTAGLVGTMLLHLLRDGDAWRRLVADPSLVPSAVEECLRYDPPNLRSSSRYALEPLHLHDATIPAGEQVSAVIGAANRDPSAFDEPDRLDVTRTPNPHLAFGHGRHHCPGAALARLEATVLLHALVTRTPDLALVTEHPTYRTSTIDRELTSLHVRRA